MRYCMYSVVNSGQMRFEWNEEKNRSNLAKHKVSFETAISVFDDPQSYAEGEASICGKSTRIVRVKSAH
jgi:uncharacterized DUF497 family protein